MESKEQRIATLAATLKSSGIAKSDAQAKMMAEDMVNVEEHVQNSFEEKHTAAHEYLQTAKNLGKPRPQIIPEQRAGPISELKSNVKPDVKKSESMVIEPPLPPKFVDVSDVHKSKISELPPVATDLHFRGKTLNQAFDHDTHNSALEAIKAQISAKVEDLSVKDSRIDEAIDIVPVVKNEPVIQEIDELLDDAEIPSGVVSEEVVPENVDVDEVIKEIEVDDAVAELAVEDVKGDVEEDIEEDVKEDVGEELQDTPKDSPKLDAQKLVELMEEDGKLEEHTREIKEKPTNVKPKEAYEENNIDLGSVFNFNKR